VLTTELLDGIPLTKIAQAVQDRDTGYLGWLRARGYDPRRVAQHIQWNMLNQVHVNGCFLTDIRPANILVLPANTIGYLDFSSIELLSGDMRGSLTQYAWLFQQGDTERAVAQLARWFNPSLRTNMDSALQDLSRLHEEFSLAMQDPAGKPSRDLSAIFALKVLVVIREHGLVVAPGVLAYLRTVCATEALRLQLAPGCDFQPQVEAFFARLVSQETRQWLDPRRLISGAFDYGFRARQMLSLVEGQEGTILTLAGAFTRTQRGARTAVRWARLVATLALVVSLALLFVRASPRLLSGQVLTDMSVDWLTLGLLGVVGALVVTVLVQSRRTSDASDAVAQAPQVQPALERRLV